MKTLYVVLLLATAATCHAKKYYDTLAAYYGTIANATAARAVLANTTIAQAFVSPNIRFRSNVGVRITEYDLFIDYIFGTLPIYPQSPFNFIGYTMRHYVEGDYVACATVDLSAVQTPFGAQYGVPATTDTETACFTFDQQRRILNYDTNQDDIDAWFASFGMDFSNPPVTRLLSIYQACGNFDGACLNSTAYPFQDGSCIVQLTQSALPLGIAEQSSRNNLICRLSWSITAYRNLTRYCPIAGLNATDFCTDQGNMYMDYYTDNFFPAGTFVDS